MTALRLQGLAPIAPRHARLLVLGSFPSAASLQALSRCAAVWRCCSAS